MEKRHLPWPESHGRGSVTSCCSDCPALEKGEFQCCSRLAHSPGAGVGAMALPVVALAQLPEIEVCSQALLGGLLLRPGLAVQAGLESHATLQPAFVWAGGRQHSLLVLAGNSIYFFPSVRALSHSIV